MEWQRIADSSNHFFTAPSCLYHIYRLLGEHQDIFPMSGYLIFNICVITLLRHVTGYDCIFGFSTGHVGTSTLSDQRSYKNTSRVKFITDGKEMSAGRSCKVTTERYMQGFSEVDEDLFVQNEFAPFIHSVFIPTPNDLIVDLRHANLYFYRGIASYFTSPKNISFCGQLHFLRIRRDRYETAASIFHTTVNGPTKPLKTDGICGSMISGYCPYHNPESVLLHPPTKRAWEMLSPLQQALWLIDETEARWQQFKKIYHRKSAITMSETYWSSGDGSLGVGRAIAALAPYLRTEPAGDSHAHPQHGSQADHEKGYITEKQRKEFLKLDREYREIMGYSFGR